MGQQLKKMKGVLLAGGTGSRMSPLTKITNKHMLPVGSKPMLQWSLEMMVNADIKDILIITGVDHMGQLVSYFGSGKDHGCKITYKVQDEARGIAHALKLAHGFVEEGEKFWVILGDNISNLDLAELNSPSHSLLVLTKNDHPERFGVYALGRIVEKPKDPSSHWIVTGQYRYTYDSEFRDILDTLIPSHRGELEITDLNNGLLSEGLVELHNHKGPWSDAGTIESYKKVNSWDWVWTKHPSATSS